MAQKLKIPSLPLRKSNWRHRRQQSLSRHHPSLTQRLNQRVQQGRLRLPPTLWRQIRNSQRGISLSTRSKINRRGQHRSARLQGHRRRPALHHSSQRKSLNWCAHCRCQLLCEARFSSGPISKEQMHHCVFGGQTY